MTEVLHQMASVPGVVGSLIYGPGGRLLATEFPDVFEKPSLEEVAAVFGEDTIIMKELGGETSFLDLRYAGGRVIVKPFATGSFVVLCTSGVNLQLLNLSMTQASRRLEKTGITPAAAAAPAAARPADVPSLKPVREKLKKAVIQELGPIGDMIFERAWTAWAASSPPSKQGLQRLIDTLATEIDDAPARQQFVGTARAIIA